MTDSVLLGAYAVLAGTLGARSLQRARWPSSAPHLAVLAWLALATSIILATAAAGLAVGLSFAHTQGDLARVLALCTETLQHHYSHPQETPALALVGLSICALAIGRVATQLIRSSLVDRRTQAACAATFDLVGEVDATRGVVVIPHRTPHAFCIGGRRSRIICTSGLLQTLEPHHLHAVLAHERAHLQQRHHAVLTVSRGVFSTLAPAFPRFRHALTLTRLHLELCADDAAERAVGRTALREVLLALGTSPSPPGAFAATGGDVAARLARLGEDSRPAPPALLALVAAVSTAVVAIPLTLTLSPAVALGWEGACRLL